MHKIRTQVLSALLLETRRGEWVDIYDAKSKEGKEKEEEDAESAGRKQAEKEEEERTFVAQYAPLFEEVRLCCRGSGGDGDGGAPCCVKERALCYCS